MRRLTVLTAFGVLATPPVAGAAPLGELPFAAISQRGLCAPGAPAATGGSR